MKMIGKLLIASVLAAGAAGCADYYGSDYGYGYDYARHSDYDRDYGRSVIWDGGRRYCRTDDGSYVYCGRD